MGGDYYDRQMDQNNPETNNNPENNNNNNQENTFNLQTTNISTTTRTEIFGGAGSTIGNTNSLYHYNAQRNKIGRQNGLHPTLDPRNYKSKNMCSTAKNPVVFALDVTGSMCEWPQIIYDKMPMFFGQIMMNKYLSDLQISFCAVADYGDEITLQVTEFSNAHEIDERISLLYLGGGMGPLVRHEAYEASAFFYSYMVDLENSELPFFFLTCDEDFYPEIASYRIKKKLGRDSAFDPIKGKKIFQDLQKKYNVFIIKKPYNDKQIESGEVEQWISAVGKERLLVIDNPKASIDLILGAIALTNGRSIEDYLNDMKLRGQTQDRVDLVAESLKIYAAALQAGKVKVVRNNAVGSEVSDKNENGNENSNLNKEKELLSNSENDKQGRLKIFYEKFQGVNFSNDVYLKELNANYEKVDREFRGKIPEELLCPLTNKLFVEPVKLNDGSIFEKEAIAKWFELFDMHPINEHKIANKSYVKDYKTQLEVIDYFETVKNLLD